LAGPPRTAGVARGRSIGVRAAAASTVRLGGRADLGHVVVQGGDLALGGPVGAELLEAAEAAGGGEVAGAVQDVAQHLGVLAQVAAQFDAAAGELVGGVDILALVGAAGAVQAVGQLHDKVGVARLDGQGGAQVLVGATAVGGDHAAGQLGLHPGGLRQAGGEFGGVGQRGLGLAVAAQGGQPRLGEGAVAGVGGLGLVQQGQRLRHAGVEFQQHRRLGPVARRGGVEGAGAGVVVQRGVQRAEVALRGAHHAMVFGVLRVLAQQRGDDLGGAGAVVAGEVGVGLVDQRGDVGGVEFGGEVERGDGGLGAAGVLEDQAEQVVQRGVLGLALQTLADALLGGLVAAQAEQQGAEVVPGGARDGRTGGAVLVDGGGEMGGLGARVTGGAGRGGAGRGGWCGGGRVSHWHGSAAMGGWPGGRRRREHGRVWPCRGACVRVISSSNYHY